MKPVRLILSSLSSAIVLSPFLASADSSVQSGAKGARLTATAHVNIKIVIPPALSLAVRGGDRPGAGIPSVSVLSNMHNASLGSTQGASSDTRGRVILSAAAGRIIAQDAACRSTDTLPVVCTASSP